jgi:hypothetical protein
MLFPCDRLRPDASVRQAEGFDGAGVSAGVRTVQIRPGRVAAIAIVSWWRRETTRLHLRPATVFWISGPTDAGPCRTFR